jgi:glycosyl transferase family 2
VATTSSSRGTRCELIHRPVSWRRPLEWLGVLSAFIAEVPADAQATLYLDAREPDLDDSAVRTLVIRACGEISGGADFAEVVLLEDEEDDPAGGAPVEKVEELLERLKLAPAPASLSSEAICDHALWAKRLVDALQADVDRALYEASPRVDTTGSPLVTVRIPTFGSTEDLIRLAIPSVLAGPYENIELLVCSDGPQPHARAAVESVADTRVRYIELDERPTYPSYPENFWRSAGTFAANRLLDEARGAFIAPLDHDDAFLLDHIPMLLDALGSGGCDWMYATAMAEYPLGDWHLHGSAPMVYGEVIHATVMYSSRLAHMRYDPDAWLLGQPVDWNLWCRMRDIGAAMGHLPRPVALHFRERSSIYHQQQSVEASAEHIAADILGTSARALLNVRRRASDGAR